MSEGEPGPSQGPPAEESPENDEASRSISADPATVVVPRWIQLVSLPLLVLGLWAVAIAAGPVLLIFAVAGVLALILDPVVRLIQRARVPRGAAVAIVYVGFWAAVAATAVLLADPIGDQIEDFRSNVPDYIE